MRHLIAVILLALLTPAAVADSGNPLPADDDQWRFTVAFPMIWAPDINGRIRGGENIDFNISFSQILENLDAGLMGELYANRGRFGVAFRFSYLNTLMEESSSGNVLDTMVKTQLDMGLSDLSASWKVHENMKNT